MKVFEEFLGGDEREVSTTMAFVRILAKLLRDKEIGKNIVPIVPGRGAHLRHGRRSSARCGIYSHAGQLYEPVDKQSCSTTRRRRTARSSRRASTEAGSLSSFMAAGSAYATHGVNMIPFFIFYSMFGFQRVGDSCGPRRHARKGFYDRRHLGQHHAGGRGLAASGRQQPSLAHRMPHVMAYDPAYAYELAVIIRDGVRRMFEEQEDVLYYLTVMNENYPMPAMPEGAEEGIVKGLYLLKQTDKKDAKLRVNLLGSGAILNEVVKAQEILAKDYDVAADVYSATSYKETYRDATACDRHNMLHPEKKPRTPYVTELFKDSDGAFVAASDYVKAHSDMLAKWLPKPIVSLGTDGFGRSEGRQELRDFFEVDARYVVVAALHALAKDEKVKPSVVAKAIKDLEIDPDKVDPLYS